MEIKNWIPTWEQLKGTNEKELIESFNEQKTISDAKKIIFEEIANRHQKEFSERVQAATIIMKNLTWWIALFSVISCAAVIYQIFSK